MERLGTGQAVQIFNSQEKRSWEGGKRSLHTSCRSDIERAPADLNRAQPELNQGMAYRTGAPATASNLQPRHLGLKAVAGAPVL